MTHAVFYSTKSLNNLCSFAANSEITLDCVINSVHSFTKQSKSPAIKKRWETRLTFLTRNWFAIKETYSRKDTFYYQLVAQRKTDASSNNFLQFQAETAYAILTGNSAQSA